MNSGPTSERVYDELKQRILAGDLVPGQRLEPAAFADQLASSVTPIRDALHRLAGERLVETRTSEGFHLPLVTEPGLRDLYGWNAQLVRIVTRSWRRGARVAIAGTLPADVERATPAFFRLFAAHSNNREHGMQVDAANDALGAARAAERRVLPGLETELRALAMAFDNEEPARLLTLVTGYHRRRDHAVPALVRALYRS